jgi:hypothetical protein
MFMLNSTHEKELGEWKAHYEKRVRMLSMDKDFYQDKYNRLRKEWNSLVDRINRLGGEKLFEQSSQSTQPTQFTDQELKRLIQLCHPDKHNSSQLSVEMTQKLNQMRK